MYGGGVLPDHPLLMRTTKKKINRQLIEGTVHFGTLPFENSTWDSSFGRPIRLSFS